MSVLRSPASLAHSGLEHVTTSAGRVGAAFGRAGEITGGAARALGTPAGAVGAAVEAAWSGAHLWIYPLGLVSSSSTESHHGYRIEHLPADDYIVLADTGRAGPFRSGGHLQQVQCIRAPCPAMPATVTVATGAHVGGVDIGDFTAGRDDLPSIAPE